METHLWLFVNHLGEYRYIYSSIAPRKMFVYDKDIDHVIELQGYHGSSTFERVYYKYSDRKIYYWGIYEKDYLPELMPTTDEDYFEAPLIGNVIPKELLKEEYLSMTFDNEPIKIEKL